MDLRFMVQPAAAVELAIIRLLCTGQDAQHGGLAGAVGSDDSDAIALRYGQTQSIEQGSGPVRPGQIASGDERRHAAESIRAASARDDCAFDLYGRWHP